MEKLFQYSSSRIDSVSPAFKRYLWDKINWNSRLIAITGARGVGKTTLLLQYIKENLSTEPSAVMYASLDDLYFSKNSLVDFAGEFVKRGGKYLFLDEIHKYRNWSAEVKNMYDYFGELRIVITGSSALDIYRGTADLSRRAVLYCMHGLSLREYIGLKYKLSFPILTLEEVLFNAPEHISHIIREIKPIKLFEEYLQYGYYPFFIEEEMTFPVRLKQIVNQVLETDLQSVEKIDFEAVQKIRTLLSILAEAVPFKPNILKLSSQVGVSRETVMKYLFLLARADLLMLLQANTRGISKMNKPEKIYLNNPNLMFALADVKINAGTVRETFLFNQLRERYKVTYSGMADFFVDGKYTIEAGGIGKNQKQIAGVENAFIAADNMEYAYQNKVPLWLFGFLY
jgi:uncharacterized protein